MRALDSLVSEDRRLSKGAGSRKLRFDVLARDNFTCRYCGRKAPAVELDVDHADSVANGGPDDPANYVTSCRDCNKGKGRASATPPEPVTVPDELFDEERVARLLADLRVPRNSATESLAQMYFEVRAAVAAMAKRLKESTTTDRQLAAALGSATGKTLQTVDMLLRVAGPQVPAPAAVGAAPSVASAGPQPAPALRPELEAAAREWNTPASEIR